MMEEILKELDLKLKDRTVVVGCSTGPDSMCLLDLVLKVTSIKKVIVAHVNHGARIESNDEEKYIKDFCKHKNILLEVTHLTLPDKNFEEEARKERYNFFSDVLNKYNAEYLLLAHNADDNLETIIMRLLKSSSLKAYAGIAKETKFQNSIIYRPLINVSKEEINKYNEANNIVSFNDFTNDLEIHFRNRIRKNITPLLKRENNGVYGAISYYSNTLFDAATYIEGVVKNFIDSYVLFNNSGFSIKISDLLELDPFIYKEVIYTLLKEENLSYKQINNLLTDIKSDNLKLVYKLKNYNFIKEYGVIIFTKESIEAQNIYVEITENGTYSFNNITLNVDSKIISYKDNNKIELCYNNIEVPFVVRSIISGDKIERNSKKGLYLQKINNILTTKKIPYLQKINTLVIEKDNKILAILGLKIK